MMEYTPQLFVDFVKKLTILDKNYRSAAAAVGHVLEKQAAAEQEAWKAVRSGVAADVNTRIDDTKQALAEYRKQLKQVATEKHRNKDDVLMARLLKCQEYLALVESVLNNISVPAIFAQYKGDGSKPVHVTLEDILSNRTDLIKMVRDLNESFKNPKNQVYEETCSTFYSTCCKARELLEQEDLQLHREITGDREDLHGKYRSIAQASGQRLSEQWQSAMEQMDAFVVDYAKRAQDSHGQTAQVRKSEGEALQNQRRALEEVFLKKFSPEAFWQEYTRIYDREPSLQNYVCSQELASSVRISTLEYDLTGLRLCEDTLGFLNHHYPQLLRGNLLTMPCCTTFDAEFNYMVTYDEARKQDAVASACGLGMRLFMMFPPRKIHFTFMDPVSLGGSFAMFRRLVDSDDRTNEVINGQIWSKSSDIEKKLQTMTDHISNVTQRCLQGKYGNIYEYNQVAGQNAEPYQILMLMDYPAGLSDRGLHLLEQIVTSGPKCGVFTIIYRSRSQLEKVSKYSDPALSAVEHHFHHLELNKGNDRMEWSELSPKNIPLCWNGVRLPSGTQLDRIIDVLKKGIKQADKIVIGIDKVSDAEISHSTAEGIRIPIGIRGADDIQYLTLGVGGSHHALVAGVAGAGKSSLLHTIIRGALTQYAPDELQIYLVDFKRGVEFKIYADYDLPSFRVVAIESEREFGYHILKNLEEEQKIRASRFKKLKTAGQIDRIEEYLETGQKMPRILVIMDEFHELFTNGNDDIAKESAIIMERIVRQGRAFGVHLILASQSYSNITGIDRAVFSQMAVRIVLKCSNEDANLLLQNGSAEIDQISIDDSGRAVYNSEAGSATHNIQFRVAYIEPSKHREMLEEISVRTKDVPHEPTKILLSNIEDNCRSIFGQFQTYGPEQCPAPGRLYLGESLSISNDMNLELMRKSCHNLMLLGADSEIARNMFTFALVSLCINYRVRTGGKPKKPFISLLSCKPLQDRYFVDTLKLVGELLPEYIQCVPNSDEEIRKMLTELYNLSKDDSPTLEQERYLFVFGYQRAEELHSDAMDSREDTIGTLFNLMSSGTEHRSVSSKQSFLSILRNGPRKGVHTILWQDSFPSLEKNEPKLMSYFNLRIAYGMTQEEYSRALGDNDIKPMSDTTAVYYNKEGNNQHFRPYQTPDDVWLEKLCQKLN